MGQLDIQLKQVASETDQQSLACKQMLIDNKAELTTQLNEMLNPNKECCTCWTIKRNKEYVQKQQSRVTDEQI